MCGHFTNRTPKPGKTFSLAVKSMGQRKAIDQTEKLKQIVKLNFTLQRTEHLMTEQKRFSNFFSNDIHRNKFGEIVRIKLNYTLVLLWLRPFEKLTINTM